MGVGIGPFLGQAAYGSDVHHYPLTTIGDLPSDIRFHTTSATAGVVVPLGPASRWIGVCPTMRVLSVAGETAARRWSTEVEGGGWIAGIQAGVVVARVPGVDVIVFGSRAAGQVHTQRDSNIVGNRTKGWTTYGDTLAVESGAGVSLVIRQLFTLRAMVATPSGVLNGRGGEKLWAFEVSASRPR